MAAYHLLIDGGQRTITAGSTSVLAYTSRIFTASREALPQEVRRQAGLVLSGTASAGIWFVLQKPLLRKYTAVESTSFASTSFDVWAGTALLSPFTVQLAHEIQTTPARASAGVLYLGIVLSAIAYVSWAFVLSKLAAACAASFRYLIPPIAVLVA